MVRLARSVWQSLGCFVRLAGDLTLDGLHFLGAIIRSRSAVSAEVLFLRKQLAFLPRAPNPPATAYRLRPIFPGSLVTAVRLEGCFGDRQARDSDRLASQGIQAVLAMEVSSRQTTIAGEYPPIDCPHDPGESDLGEKSEWPRSCR